MLYTTFVLITFVFLCISNLYFVEAQNDTGSFKLNGTVVCSDGRLVPKDTELIVYQYIYKGSLDETEGDFLIDEVVHTGENGSFAVQFNVSDFGAFDYGFEFVVRDVCTKSREEAEMVMLKSQADNDVGVVKLNVRETPDHFYDR